MTQFNLDFACDEMMTEREPDCLETCDDVCLGYCQIPGPEPPKEWTVEEIEDLPGEQPKWTIY